MFVACAQNMVVKDVAVSCDQRGRLLVGATNTQPSGCLVSWQAGVFRSAGCGAYTTRVHGCGGCGSVQYVVMC